MTQRPPLAQLEGQRLEFKGREALKKPSKIVRAIVGMLNADGGSIWVGIEESNEIAVALEHVESSVIELRRLGDVITETIEPSPTQAEVELTEVLDEGTALIRIDVCPTDAHRPYAQLSQHRRSYVRRVGARCRPMARHELEEEFRRSQNDGDAQHTERIAVVKKIQEVREKKRDSGYRGLFLHLQPHAELSVKINSADIVDLFQQWDKTGNREGGFNFVSPYVHPRRVGRAIAAGWGDPPVVKLWETGRLELSIPLDLLRFTDTQELHPLKIIEHTTALFRFASVLFNDHLREDPAPSQTHVFGDLSLFGVKGRDLSSFPEAAEWATAHIPPFEAEDMLLTAPLGFQLSDVLDFPDRCAFQLYRIAFHRFGREDADIPFYDRTTEKLVLPG